MIIAAERAATRKSAKYTDTETNYVEPLGSLGPINTHGRNFLSKLGRKLCTQVR